MSKIELSKEQNDAAMQKLKNYFECERDEPIGDLQSKLILDFILEKIGPFIYNQAVIDMQKSKKPMICMNSCVKKVVI